MRRNPTLWIVLIVVALVAGFFGGRLSGGAAAEDPKLAARVDQLEQELLSIKGQLEGLASAADLASLEQQLNSLAQEVQQLKATGVAGPGLKIAYINAEEVFLKYKGTAAAVQRFSAEKAKKEQELRQLESDFEAGKLSREEYESRVMEIQRELQRLDLELTAKVQQEMLQVITEVAREKGYDWVTRKKDVVLYVKEGLMDDITSLVIQRLNAKLEAQEQGQGATTSSPGEGE